MTEENDRVCIIRRAGKGLLQGRHSLGDVVFQKIGSRELVLDAGNSGIGTIDAFQHFHGSGAVSLGEKNLGFEEPAVEVLGIPAEYVLESLECLVRLAGLELESGLSVPNGNEIGGFFCDGRVDRGSLVELSGFHEELGVLKAGRRAGR